MTRKPSLGNRVSDWWYERDQRTKIALTVVTGLVLLALCIGAASAASRLLRPGPEPEPTPTAVSMATTAPAAPTAPTSPTTAPTATLASTETSAPAPTPEPSAAPSADPQGDVTAYDSGDPVEGAPAGVDISGASPGPDLRVALQPADDVPAELAGWAAEDEVLLWITLYEPIPEPPAEYREWVFALDLDGDIETGRPAGSARINPDLGMEVAVALYYDPASEEYGTYLLVWDTDQGKWATGPETRYYLDEPRTLVGLALPLETLAQVVAETSGVTVVSEAARGRAAALAETGEQKMIDFYPDLPD